MWLFQKRHACIRLVKKQTIVFIDIVYFQELMFSISVRIVEMDFSRPFILVKMHE